MFDFSTIKSSLKRKFFGSPATPKDSTRPTIDELKRRVAVRFFVKRSRRFGLLNQAFQQRMQDVAAKLAARTKTTPDCLRYLGLTPRGEKIRDDKRKRESRIDDFQFPKPRLYECDYCPKILFHKKLYRSHMLKHIRMAQRCNKCHTSFTSKVAKRKHQMICRR